MLLIGIFVAPVLIAYGIVATMGPVYTAEIYITRAPGIYIRATKPARPAKDHYAQRGEREIKGLGQALKNVSLVFEALNGRKASA